MSFRNRARKGLVSLLTASALIGGSLGLGGCLTTGRNYNHNASYLSDSNSLQRSHDVNTLTGGILGTPYSRDELNRDQEQPYNPTDNLPRASSSLDPVQYTQPDNLPAARSSLDQRPSRGTARRGPSAEVDCSVKWLNPKNHYRAANVNEMYSLGPLFWKEGIFCLKVKFNRRGPGLGTWLNKIEDDGAKVVHYWPCENMGELDIEYPASEFKAGNYQIIVGTENEIYVTEKFKVDKEPDTVVNRH